MSISVVAILFVIGFSVRRQKSFFTSESVCIICANSFFKNCPNCVKLQFLQHESKQTFPENLRFEKRDYHFQTEVVPYLGTGATFIGFKGLLFLEPFRAAPLLG